MSLLRVPSEVLTVSRLIDAKPGDVLARPGEIGNDVYLLESGLLQIDRHFPDGDRSVRIVGPGEIAGEEALLGEPYLQQLEALTTVALRVINISTVSPSLLATRWLLNQMTQQMKQTDQEIHWMRIHSVDVRVQLHLLALHAKSNGSHIPVTQSDFAHLVGATRETISTALNRLARAGAIRLSRGSIAIVRPEMLGADGQAARGATA